MPVGSHRLLGIVLVDSAEEVGRAQLGGGSLVGDGAQVGGGAGLGASFVARPLQPAQEVGLVGARDVYVARAFVRRITLRAMTGALTGMLAGVAGVAVLPPATGGTGLLAQFGFVGAEWGWPAFLPFAAGVVAFWASRTAALNTLKRTA